MEESVSDAERDLVVRELTRHCGDGRLTLGELEDRIEAAYEATTRDELDALLRDMPREPTAASTPPVPPPLYMPPTTSAGPAPTPFPSVPSSKTTHPAREKSEREKALGALFAIGGFVLLFNGMFWLAIICWFVLPGLILNSRRG